MKAQQILDDQVIHVKRGRLNTYGFEPCANSYFDFYLSPKYIEPSLIKLEDIGLHLYLRKNLNDKNPQWKMPTIRQMMRLLGISQKKLTTMMARLDCAQLLKKESGARTGEKNVRNDYVLSDPILALDEFLFVANAGAFGQPLKPEWTECITQQYTTDFSVLPGDTSGVLPSNTDLHSSSSTEGMIWMKVLEALKTQLPSATYYTCVADTKFLRVDNNIALIMATRSADWIENRLGKQIAKLLNLEYRMLDPETTVKVEGVRCIVAEG